MDVTLLKRFIIFLCCLLFAISLSIDYAAADEVLKDEIPAGLFSKNNAPVTSKDLLKVNAGSAIVMDYKSGRVLYEKNARVKRPMASTTKIMTAILAIEKGNLDDMVTVSRRAAEIWGSTINLKEGEKLKLRELLYGMMLESGNDAAIAVAEHIGGTVENFADMMTAKAAEIGAVDTSFKSPHGLDMDGHYSTAYDLALITRYAMGNPVFNQIVATKSTVIGNRILYNTNEMLDLYPGADGVKTGYTGQAGRCLITSATRGGMRLISVVLNCATRTIRAESSRIMLDYSFGKFKNYTLLKCDEAMGAIPVTRGRMKEVRVQAVDSIELPLSAEEIAAMKKEIVLPDSLEAPVGKGIEVGRVVFTVNGELMGESALKTSYGVSKKNVMDYLGEIFISWGRILRGKSIMR